MRKQLSIRPRIKILHKEYASFRPEIVEFFVSTVLPKANIIFDPLAGTAPLIPYIAYSNLTAYFNDILPFHSYVNRAKTYQIFASIIKRKRNPWEFIERELARCLGSLRKERLRVSANWIADDILNRLLHAWNQTGECNKATSDFLKAVIILCLRSFSCASRGSTNATWYKPGGMTSQKNVSDVIRDSIDRFRSYYDCYYGGRKNIRGGQCHFMSEDAAIISLKDKVDTILTSPAYPNRYDYTVMYAPELYFLSKTESNGDMSELKGKMLASNVVRDYQNPECDLAALSKKAPKTRAFLYEVERKAPEGESNYYLRCFTKYFSNLYKILDNSIEILSSNGALYIVLQNNIHRGELIDMADFVSEYLGKKGLTVKIVFEKLQTHQGRRNISADHPLVVKKHREVIIKARK